MQGNDPLCELSMIYDIAVFAGFPRLLVIRAI